MGQNNHRSKALKAAATQYFVNAGLHDHTECDALLTFLHRMDRLVSRLTALAEQKLPSRNRGRILVHLTAGMNLSPEATGQSGDYFRIDIPMHLVHRLWDMAWTCSDTINRSPSQADQFETSATLAVMMAFAHELNHVFTGHVFLPTDPFQESNSDFRAGGCLAGWLHRPDIRLHLGLETATNDDIAHAVVTAALMLGLLFTSPATPGNAEYPHYPAPLMRFRLLLAGYLFYQEVIDPSRLPALNAALRNAPAWAPAMFTPLGMAEEIRLLIDDNAWPPAASAPTCHPADSQTRIAWYKRAVLLRPIIKSLLALTRRDAQRGL